MNKVWKDLLSFIGEDDLAQVGPPRSTQVGSCLIVSVKDGDLSTMLDPISIIVVVVCDIMNAMMNVEDPGSQYQVSIFLVIACRVGYGRQVGLCDITSAIFSLFFKIFPKTFGLCYFGLSQEKSQLQERRSWHSPMTGRQGQGSQGRFGLNGRITRKSTCYDQADNAPIVVFAHFIFQEIFV